MSENLIESLSVDADFIPLTMGLYEGRLVKTETELFFIAERFNGWEIMERCERSDIQKVEVSESFMGIVAQIHTSGTHWTLKDLPEGTNVQEWLLGHHPDSLSGTDVQILENRKLSLDSVTSVSNNMVQQSIDQTMVRETMEIYPADIQKMRKACEMNPSFQNRISTFLKEPYDGTDDQLRRFLQRNPEALDMVQRLSDVTFTLMKGLVELKAKGAEARSQLVVTGCGFAIMGVPFLWLFVVFLIESCSR